MPITPNDILTKDFDREFRGYAREEVNEFLDEIVVDYERALDQVTALKRQLAEADEKIKNFEKLQESLNSSILIANEAAERLKQNARKEAELIIYEAERESDRIIANAHDTVNHLANEVELLRHNGRNLQFEMQRMLTQQLDLIKSQTFEQEIAFATPATEDSQAEERSSERVAALEQEVETQVTSDVEEFVHETQGDVEAKAAPDKDDQASVESILGQTIKIELPEMM